MDERIEGRISLRGLALRVARPLASLVAAAMLLAAVGCATPKTSAEDETAAVSKSRCAPGAVLDDRHALCNGQTGRWW